jgi:hypothetical protein
VTMRFKDNAEYEEFLRRRGNKPERAAGTRADLTSSSKVAHAAPAGESQNSSTPAKPRMNKTEARFAALLEGWLRAGDIAGYKFEAVTLRLAPHTHYRTDFVVWLKDGRTRFYEVKGGYVREDSWLKLKTVAVLFPQWEFVRAQWKGGGWQYLTLPKE